MLPLPIPTDKTGKFIKAAFQVDRKDYDPNATIAKDQILDLLSKVHTTNSKQVQPVDIS